MNLDHEFTFLTLAVGQGTYHSAVCGCDHGLLLWNVNCDVTCRAPRYGAVRRGLSRVVDFTGCPRLCDGGSARSSQSTQSTCLTKAPAGAPARRGAIAAGQWNSRGHEGVTRARDPAPTEAVPARDGRDKLGSVYELVFAWYTAAGVGGRCRRLFEWVWAQ